MRKPGIAAVYSQLNLPVVPVALNSGLFWGRRIFIKWPGVITLEFLPGLVASWGKGLSALLYAALMIAAIVAMPKGIAGTLSVLKFLSPVRGRGQVRGLHELSEPPLPASPPIGGEEKKNEVSSP